MKNTLVIKVIIILFLSFSAHSKQNNIIGGYGLLDCGEIISDWEKSAVFKNVYGAYLNGVLTGMFYTTNTATTSSPQALQLYTLNYCKQNPLEPFMYAIEETIQKVAQPLE